MVTLDGHVIVIIIIWNTSVIAIDFLSNIEVQTKVFGRQRGFLLDGEDPPVLSLSLLISILLLLSLLLLLLLFL